MNVETGLPESGADDFARRFALRAANLMWLLGAGASASAGMVGFRTLLQTTPRGGFCRTPRKGIVGASIASCETPRSLAIDLTSIIRYCKSYNVSYRGR